MRLTIRTAKELNRGAPEKPQFNFNETQRLVVRIQEERKSASALHCKIRQNKRVKHPGTELSAPVRWRAAVIVLWYAVIACLLAMRMVVGYILS
ncbi:hypothetical protein Trydic_g23736 [Trypoxylus dichotomus]